MSRYLGLVSYDDGVFQTTRDVVVEAEGESEAECKILATYYVPPDVPVDPRMIYRVRVCKLEGEPVAVSDDKLCQSLTSFLLQEEALEKKNQDLRDWEEYQRLKKIFEPTV